MIQGIKEIIRRLFNWRYVLTLKGLGKCASIKSGVVIQGLKYVTLGDNVTLAPGVYLQAIDTQAITPPNLQIEEGTLVGRNSQICATGSIKIGRDCIFAGNCFISDTTHTYEDINMPIIQSPLKNLKPVIIGEGSWLGRNASIIGASIGKHCVVGNCCFVTKDIPDFCVVVGNPCRIIKRYNFETKQWEKTDKNGNFL